MCRESGGAVLAIQKNVGVFLNLKVPTAKDLLTSPGIQGYQMK